MSRETLARALASEEARERFAERYGIDDAKLEEAVHAGLVRGVDDAEDAGRPQPDRRRAAARAGASASRSRRGSI